MRLALSLYGIAGVLYVAYWAMFAAQANGFPWWPKYVAVAVTVALLVGSGASAVRAARRY